MNTNWAEQTNGIYSSFQNEFAKSNQDLNELRIAEAKAIASPGKKVKVVAGMYFYVATNGNAVFTISTYGEEYPGMENMWRVESAKPGTNGDYESTMTLKYAIEGIEHYN